MISKERSRLPLRIATEMRLQIAAFQINRIFHLITVMKSAENDEYVY